MKKLLPFLLLLPATAVADFSYDYLDVGYLRGEVDQPFFHTDFDGLEIGGSKSVGGMLVVGDYERVTTDPVNLLGMAAEYSWSYLRLGAGIAFEPVEWLAIVPAAGFARGTNETDTSGSCPVCIADDDSDTGYFVRLGLRARLLAPLELEYGHRFTNIFGDRLNDWRVDLRYHITPGISVSAGYHDYEGDAASGLTARWNF